MKVIRYSFEMALIYMKQGREVRRKDWPDGHVIRKRWKKIYLAIPNKPLEEVKLTSADILSVDWEVVQ